MDKYVKMGIAGLLLVALLALGGLSIAGSSTRDWGLANLVSPVAAIGQKIQAQSADLRPQQNTVQSNSSAPQATSPSQQGGVVDARPVVRQVGPAVVTVVNKLQVQTQGTNGSNPFGNGNGNNGTPSVPAPEALGSGLIIENQGYIVTNNHVIENQQSLEVIFADGTRASARVIGGDSFSDLAVIKVDDKMPAVAQLGDSDALEPGQPVVAIGSALGDYRNTVTEGIVSGLHRSIDGTTAGDFIQTDAAINHGNSGGPLIDMSGKVIGINTAVVRSAGAMGDAAEGLGFAIPSNTVKQVADQLIKSGAITRPFMGITSMMITPQVAAYYNLSRQQGVFVTDVRSGSPADKAGIVANSIITRFDGTELTGDTTLVELVMNHKVGDSVKLSIIPPNSTQEKEVTVVLGTRPANP
jgi:2-alkenal reductase